MSDLSFEQMLEESLKTIRNGEVVEGTFKNGKMAENPKVKLPIKKIVIPSVDFDITQY